MSEFGILDSQYRLIETRFLDDWVIFKALEVSTERVVVIRTPNQRLKADHTRFESVRIAVSRLPTSEGAATRYFPAGTIDQHEYVVSTWIDTTLQTLLDAEDTLSVAYSLELLEQGLAALSASQNEGFVHGRLTPACFGIAGDRLVLDRLVLDTQIQEAIYAPPEVVGAVSLADGRSDIYALGVMVYRMLLGAARFDNATRSVASSGNWEPLAQLEASVPTAVSHVIQGMVASDYTKRFASAVLAHTALSEALSVTHLETQPHPPAVAPSETQSNVSPNLTSRSDTQEITPRMPALSSDSPDLQRDTRRRGAMPALVTVVVLVLAIGTGWYGWHFVHKKGLADSEMSAATQARERAQAAQANLFALEQFAQAKHSHHEAQQSYTAHRFGSAGVLATQAQLQYEQARATAVRAEAQHALASVMTVYRAALGVDDINTSALNTQLQNIRNIEDKLEGGDHLTSKADLTIIEDKIAGLVTKARHRSLEKSVEQLSTHLATQQTDTSDNFKRAIEEINTAREALESGDLESASTRHQEAQALFDNLVSRARWRHIERTRELAGNVRQEAIEAGADALPRFSQAELDWRTANEGWTAKNDNVDESTFSSLRDLFMSLLAEQGAREARQNAEKHRNEIRALNALFTLADLTSPHQWFARGEDQLRADLFADATTS